MRITSLRTTVIPTGHRPEGTPMQHSRPHLARHASRQASIGGTDVANGTVHRGPAPPHRTTGSYAPHSHSHRGAPRHDRGLQHKPLGNRRDLHRDSRGRTHDGRSIHNGRCTADDRATHSGRCTAHSGTTHNGRSTADGRPADDGRSPLRARRRVRHRQRRPHARPLRRRRADDRGVDRRVHRGGENWGAIEAPIAEHARVCSSDSFRHRHERPARCHADVQIASSDLRAALQIHR